MSEYLLARRAKMFGSPQPEIKKVRTVIAKKSAKRKTEDKEYKKIVKEMMAVSDKCELNVEGVCVKRASGLHHKARRGKNYLNKEFLMRACDPCNGWIESFPLEAMKRGFLISKFVK